MFKKIKELFSKQKQLRQEEQIRAIMTIVEAVINSQEISDSHLIALARLSFIKPEVLVREGHNIKGNAEYLLEMVKAQENMKGKAK